MRFNEEQCERIAKHAFSKHSVSQYYTVEGLNEAISQLPELYRKCLELRFVNNLTYREIAERIGKSHQSARDYVEKSMMYLRRPFIKAIVEGESGNPVDMDTPIDISKLSCRVYNSLRRAGITTFGDLVSMSYDDLCKVRNLGSRGLKEVSEMMESYGLMINDISLKPRTEETVKLSIPKNILFKGHVTVSFDYNYVSGVCTITEIH